MAKNFTLEPVIPGELEEFSNLDRDIFGLPDAFLEEWFPHFLNFWVATSSGRIGAVMFGLHMDRWLDDMPPQRPGSMYIASIGFLPAFRGEGYGADVLAWLRGYAARNGCSRVVFETREGNVPMQRLAARQGYSVVGFLPNFYSEPTETGIVYEWTARA